MTDAPIEVQAAKPTRLGALDSVLDRASDGFNPILVKELRQSLRGKAFRIAFLCVLVLLTFAAVGALLSANQWGQAQGNQFFMGVYVCMGIALYGLVPFAAFASMGGEWEDNTFDLLILSNLRPGDVIRGKLISAGVQAVLYISTFSPFLACAFLMQGVDLGALIGIVFISFVWSVSLSMLAISLSTLARQRFLRIAMMAMLAGALASAYGFAIGGAEELLDEPDYLRDREFWEAALGFFMALSFLVALLYQVACNQLAHPEENRSTHLRVITSLAVLCGIGWTGYMLAQHPSGDASSGLFTIMLFLGVVLPSVLFVSEPNRLGRRVAADLRRHPKRSLLLAPWLPGGGRGVWFFALHLGLLVIAYTLIRVTVLSTGTYPLGQEGMFAFYGMCFYATGYVLLPSGLLSKNLERLPVRIAARVLVPFLALVLFVLPALLAFLFGIGDLDSFRHPGNPGYFAQENWNEFQWPIAWLVVAGFAGIAVLINLPRAFRGLSEVEEARKVAPVESRTEPTPPGP